LSGVAGTGGEARPDSETKVMGDSDVDSPHASASSSAPNAADEPNGSKGLLIVCRGMKHGSSRQWTVGRGCAYVNRMFASVGRVLSRLVAVLIVYTCCFPPSPTTITTALVFIPSMFTPTQLAPEATQYGKLIGAVVLNGIFQSFLLGFVLGQMVKYWYDYRDDSRTKRAFVTLIVILSTSDTSLYGIVLGLTLFF
jgi:hypothetical protein